MIAGLAFIALRQFVSNQVPPILPNRHKHPALTFQCRHPHGTGAANLPWPTALLANTLT
jgi:hypothetical protein